MKCWLVGSEFYGPANTNKVMSSRSDVQSSQTNTTCI